MASIPKRGGCGYPGRVCCVKECKNSYKNTDKSVSFYAFPGRAHEKQRRESWVNAVQKFSAGMELWEPKKGSVICSQHFVGNKKSNHPLHPAYNPTIFGAVCAFNHKTSEQCVQRFERMENRNKKREAPVECLLPVDEALNCLETPQTETPVRSNNKACQVNFSVAENVVENFLFHCNFSKQNNDVGCQANIPLTPLKKMKHFADQCVGNDEEVHMCNNGFHGIQSMKGDQDINSLCGVTMPTFKLLLSYVQGEHGNQKLTTENKLLLFLIKMKLGISYRALGVLFTIHSSTVSRIFLAILNELFYKTYKFVMWPSRPTVDNTMPTAFRMHYPRCRAVIDCSEVKITQPSSIENRIYVYSQYKNAYTAKFFIAITPNGFISFVSKCYGGRSSDTFITNDCGFLDLLQPNDIVLADKGFPGITCRDNAVIVMPPFLHSGHLSVEEVEETYTIASVRVHVERSIQRVKIYKIIKNIDNNLFPHVDKIVRMCCVLANLQPPIIKEQM